MILLNDLSMMESVDSTRSIIGGKAPKIVASVGGIVVAGVSGRVRGSVSPHGSSGNASYGAAGSAAGAAAGAVGCNPVVGIIHGVGFSI